MSLPLTYTLRPLPPTPPPTPPQHNTLSSLAIRALYPPSTPLSLTHLTALEITVLTRALSPLTVFPSPYQNEPLPASLLKSSPLPQALTTAVLRKVGASAALPSAPALCHGHRHLNAQLMGSVLDTILSEVEDWLPEVLLRIAPQDGDGIGKYLPSLERLHRTGLPSRSTPLKSTRAAYKRLSPLALHHVRAAEDVLALVVSAEEFVYLYGREAGTFSSSADTPSSPKPAPSHSRFHHSRRPHRHPTCPACTLSILSSTPSTLIGLRSILLARLPSTVLSAHTRSPPLELVQGFMACFGSGEAAHMLRVSGRVGRELSALIEAANRQMRERIPEMPGRPGRSGMPGRPEKIEVVVGRAEMVVQQGQKGPPEVRYASKPRFEAPRKPLPAPPLWSPLLPMRASCVPGPLRVGERR